MIRGSQATPLRSPKPIGALVLICCACSSTATPRAVGPKPKLPTYEIPEAPDWRKDVPSSGSQRRSHTPKLQTAKLRNGLTVIVSEEHRFPIVSLVLVTRGGSATDPPMRPGLTFVTYGSLRDGAGKRSAAQFEGTLGKLGAELVMSVEQDYGAVGLQGLSKHSSRLAALLADAVMRPHLSENSLKWRRKRQASDIVERRGSMAAMAVEHLPRLIYGARHPFGHPAHGSPRSLRQVEIRELRQHYRRLIRPDRSALIATGNVSFEQVVKLAKRRFGRWRAKGPPFPDRATPVEAKPRRTVTVLHRENVSQTFVCVARPVPGVNHQDEIPLEVTNDLFGGAFNSRLQMNLREEKGYTYGAYSYLKLSRGAGSFVACSRIRRNATAKGLEAFLNEMDGMRSKPPSKQEVSRAASGLALRLSNGSQSIEALGEVAMAMFVDGRPADYLEKVRQELNGIDPDVVRSLSIKYLAPATMQILLVGNARAIIRDIEPLNLGKVLILRQ